MARSIRRKSLLSRLFTTYLTLVVVVMFTGIAGAVPVSFAEENQQELTELVMAPEGSEESSESPPPPDPGSEQPPAFEDEDEVPADGDEDLPDAPDAGALAVSAFSVSAEELEPSTGQVGLTLEGYNSEQAKWTTGNLGKDYREGDWVPYRFTIDNRKGTEQYVFGAFSFRYSHFDSNKNAIMVDMTREWRVGYQATAPGTNDSPGPVGTPVTPSVQDQPNPPGDFGATPFLLTDFPVGAVIVPAGQYAVVYYQAHLALTAWWQQQSPPRDGASGYPGSSAAMRLNSPSGDKTVSIPVVPRPAGHVQGVKFNDYNGNGVWDQEDPREVGLEGWEFTLSNGPAGFPLSLKAVSGSDGTFMFGPLPDGTYSLNEKVEDGWEPTTPLPMAVVVAGGQTTYVEVGNFQRMPAIDLVKSGTFNDENGDGVAQAGETITYTFTVENTGNVTLYDVVVTDPLVTVMGGPIAELAPGEVDSTTFSGVYAVTQIDINDGHVFNTATVTGYDAQGVPVTDTDVHDELLPQ